MKTSYWRCLLLCWFCSATAGSVIAQKNDTVFICFKQSSSVPDAWSKTKLNELADNFYQYSSITVNGRASEEGTPGYNLKLSEKRADAVIHYLHKKNFPGETNKNVFGENHHIGNANDLTINRSAELILTRIPSDELQMQKFLSENYPSASLYDYNVTRGLKITSDDGTYIDIPPYAFVYPDGQAVSGKIEVRVSKIRKMNEILESGMNTITDHGPLQTAGMFEIKAFKNGRGLKLRKGNAITLNVPADSVYSDMKIFNMNDSSRTWYEAGDNFRLNPVNYTINYGLFFKEKLTDAEKIERNKNIELLKNERRNFLNILLGALVKDCREDKINRLISLFNIQGINMSFTVSAAGSRGLALFEGKTQRVLKMDDEQFANVNFENINAISTTINYETSVWTDQPESVDMNGATLKYYDVKLTVLSLVNCDRFVDYPKIDNVIVNNNQIQNVKTYMIFPSLNCIVPGGVRDSLTVKFYNVPKKQQAVIFAFGVKKGTWYYAKKTITTQDQKEELNWIKSDIEAIKKEMKNI